jgi:uncharacterized protein
LFLKKTPHYICLKQRKLRLNDLSSWRQHWHSDPLISHFGNVISAGLEILEEYIVAAVERAERVLKDVYLQEQAQLFLAQERHHQTVHHSFNQFLIECGYVHLCQTQLLYQGQYGAWVQSDKMEDLERLLRAVCGFEHLASTVGRFFLSLLQQDAADLHEPTAYVFAFHAAEELEHKGVCFDCYQDIFQQSPISTSLHHQHWQEFLANLQQVLCQSLRYFFTIDRVQGHAGISSDEQIYQRLFGAQGILSPGGDLHSYEKPGFHPWDIDDRGLIQYWDGELEPQFHRLISSASASA